MGKTIKYSKIVKIYKIEVKIQINPINLYKNNGNSIQFLRRTTVI